MIYTNKLKTDLRSREILPGNFEENLLVCMKTSPDRYPHKCIPWHWHDCFEIDYVLQGEMDLHISEHIQPVKQGDILFLNQGVMHKYQGREGSCCVVYAILFDMHLLSGLYNSRLEREYMLPIRESGMDYYTFSADSPLRLTMAQAVLNAVELLRAETYGYEMKVRTQLSDFWLALLQDTRALRAETPKAVGTDTERIKKMLEFIHTNYADKLTVESIAAAADVSERECGRCFERCIGKPPVKYLNDYRLHRAAELLLESDRPILEISEECGFSSASYFGKSFAESMGCTPREYRISGGVFNGKPEK